VSVIDCRFGVNLDVYDNYMLDVGEISRLKETLKALEVGDKGMILVGPRRMLMMQCKRRVRR